MKVGWEAKRQIVRILAGGYEMVEIQVNLDRLFPNAVRMPSVAPTFLSVAEAREMAQWLLDNTPEDADDYDSA